MNEKNIWAVDNIEILADKRVRVVLATDTGGHQEFVTRKFGVGRRGAKTAALAKFAAKAGLGDVGALYRHFRCLPEDYRGAVLPRRFDRGVSRLAGIQ